MNPDNAQLDRDVDLLVGEIWYAVSELREFQERLGVLVERFAEKVGQLQRRTTPEHPHRGEDR